jgi:hypothetical protein
MPDFICGHLNLITWEIVLRANKLESDR